MNLEHQIKNCIRDVVDFPKPGIVFKDLTPVLNDTKLCHLILDELVEKANFLKPDVIAGLESRGFWFGMPLALALKIPFVPLRKKGKLPYKTNSYTYKLEYGEATIEAHVDAFIKGQKVLIHDDLLATGGTASAAAELIKLQNASVVGFSFLVDLSFLNGKDKLSNYAENIHSLVRY